MEKKYEMIEETKILRNGVKLHRIKALRDFNDVKAGELGGWIEKEDNISHEGNCWVYGDAKVYGDAMVFGNARICGHASIHRNAAIAQNATIKGYGEVLDNAIVCGTSTVSAYSTIKGYAVIKGNSKIKHDTDKITYGLFIDAHIKNNNDFITFDNIGDASMLTFYNTKDNGIYVTALSMQFAGTIKEFKECVIEKYKGKTLKEYLSAIKLAKLKLNK